MKRLTLLGLAAAFSLFAQGAGFRPGPGGFGGFGPGGPPPGRTVTGSPYSATRTYTTQQILADGNIIRNQRSETVYRDSQGRVRTESAETRPGANGASTTVTRIHVTDPVAGVNREIDNEHRVVTEMSVRPAGRQGPPPAGRKGPPPNDGGRRGPGQGPQNDPNVTTTDLGTQTINGVVATGRRTTRTIPAGSIGNAAPIQTTREVWTSADLKETVLVKESDPRFGTTVTEMTNINRAEPDPGLFQAPAGYTVRQGPAGGPRPGRGGSQQ